MKSVTVLNGKTVLISGKKVAITDPSVRALGIRPANARERLFIKLERAFRQGLERFAQTAKDKFDRGEKAVLPQILSLYLSHNKLPPKWVRRELIKACGTAGKSWDDLFGKHPRQNRKLSQKQARAYHEGEKLRKQGHKVSIDDLFLELGKVLDIPASTARDHYYASAAKKKAERLSGLAEILGAPKDCLVVNKIDKLVLLAQRSGIPVRELLAEPLRELRAQPSVQRDTSEKPSR
jgi:hypothetical protein